MVMFMFPMEIAGTARHSAGGAAYLPGLGSSRLRREVAKTIKSVALLWARKRLSRGGPYGAHGTCMMAEMIAVVALQDCSLLDSTTGRQMELARAWAWKAETRLG
jgi:hypothetical protein